ncbi:MAG: folylpolyglutamate synthase/dihydrofolate synthase family protein [Thermoguttaceae bacterium]
MASDQNVNPNDPSPYPSADAAHAAAMEFLLGRIDYERALAVPYRAREFKLDRMRQLLRRLGDPQRTMPIIHIAGTKGKGSTAAMIGAILTAAGHRAGLFTSPHFERIEERLAVDAVPCSAEEFTALIQHIRPEVEAMDRLVAEEDAEEDPDESGPTYFEITTAMALLHFARRKVDAAVLEVGLGGRLDSTNVCEPCVSVITSISFDHTRQLGTTLAAIAREKAGIIKPGVPVVSGVVEDEPRETIRKICRTRGCRLVERAVDFEFRYDAPRHMERKEEAGRFDFCWHGRDADDASAAAYDAVPLRLLGPHQAANAAVALATIGELQRAGWKLPEAAIRKGLGEVSCPGRIEIVRRRPVVVIDTAHNGASIEALVGVLRESFSVGRRLLMFAATQEKDLRGMLDHLLGAFDHVVFTRYKENPRAVPPEQLQALAQELTASATERFAVFADPDEAWEAIRRAAGPEDLICITGSFFIAAEMRRRAGV